MKLLEIKNLKVEANGEKILKGVNLKIAAGDIQALLGPNASGKSTLAYAILGHPGYKITEGKIFFQGKDISRLSPEKRVKLGITLTFQNPPAIKGVKLFSFLKKIAQKRIVNKKLGLAPSLLDREVNLDFSGGEKKISELLQVLLLSPKLVIFDEIDSGLDIKKTEKVAKIIKDELISKGVAVFIITHSGQILNFLKPNLTNVLVEGKIVCQGKDYRKVLETIKKYGYERCKKCSLSTGRRKRGSNASSLLAN